MGFNLLMKGMFIIGTGRTGTHLMCNTLLTYENVRDDVKRKGPSAVENTKRLTEVTQAAVLSKPLPEHVVKSYSKAMQNDKVFVNQDHPNLWHVQQLLDTFPDIIFFAMKRPIVQVVSSMMQKNATHHWFEWGKDNTEFPNKFLGLKLKESVSELSKEELCTHRVRSHYKEIDRIKKIYKDKVIIVDFEELVKSNGSHDYLRTIMGSQLKELGKKIKKYKTHPEVLEKFKSKLSQKQLNKITKLEKYK